MKKILIISDNYPSSSSPTKGMFLYQLADEFSKNNQVEVLVPTVRFKNKKNSLKKISRDIREVIFPTYWSFSNFSLLQGLSYRSKANAILKSSKSLSFIPDFIYTHFLWNAIVSIPLKKKLNKPLFVAMGESSTERYSKIIRTRKFKEEVLPNIDGFICVSQKLYDFVELTLKVPKEKIILVPNGVDNSRFFPMDKSELKVRLNISQQQFVISFIGAFIERKGINDLLLAVKDMDNVGLICIGKGEIADSSKIIFADTLLHEKIPQYIGASDLFVFPTRAEGSSNALLEAMACGLPIITSNIPEVINQIGSENALYVTVGDVSDLKKKIELMKDKSLRDKYSAKSLDVAKKYSLNQRSKIILDWINEKI